MEGATDQWSRIEMSVVLRRDAEEQREERRNARIKWTVR
jgi:hypothetical protein